MRKEYNPPIVEIEKFGYLSSIITESNGGLDDNEGGEEVDW